MIPDGLIGGAWDDWETYTVLPLRAFEYEFGCSRLLVSRPGRLHQGGRRRDDQEASRNKIKHGRESMQAIMSNTDDVQNMDFQN